MFALPVGTLSSSRTEGHVMDQETASARRHEGTGSTREGVERRIVARGEDDHLNHVQELVSGIRRRDGVLTQRPSYVEKEYRLHMATLLFPETGREPGDLARVLGFAVVHQDGYLSLLGVDPDRRREGLGTELLAFLGDRVPSLSCHVRSSNESALAFYRARGFSVRRRLAGYYADGGDALLCRRSDD